MMKTAIVIGSTGLVGSELVKLLLASPHYGSVLLLNRRASGLAHPKIVERIVDFDAPDLTGISGDDFYCALGTTLRKAGSKAAQHEIDCEYPTTIATHLRNQGIRQMILVSSVGADASAASFYLRTKGELEKNLIALGFESTVILRPSVLVGKRAEFRLGEQAGILLMKILSPFIFGALRKYKGIEASQVAQCMVREANSGAAGVRFLEFDQIRNLE
jgi:uncharacterized protein YbjT (DUF2867 family)